MKDNNDFYVGLPDFVTMTNVIESRGYQIGYKRLKKGILAMYRFNGGEWKVGSIIYYNCMDAQKAISTRLYKLIQNN